ncbi:hypothetical protein HDU67_004437 [Dinochytrium kinnereticum]|nr:hypothetical protein HDU67_004437 [Dinochytrium kinnereticum]
MGLVPTLLGAGVVAWTMMMMMMMMALPVTRAGPCVVFDSGDRVYFFGVAGGDAVAETVLFNATPTLGRPPFDGENTRCFLSHYIDAIYVMNGDKANPRDIHIYQVSTGLWSTQKVDSGPSPNPSTSLTAIDHNTNVFYSLDLDTSGTLYNLKIGDAATVASPIPVKWDVSTSLSFGQTFSSATPRSQYPAVGPAHNHLYYLNVPGVEAGEARAFVIHYNYEQPEVVRYSGAAFPKGPGTGVMLFRTDMQPSSVFGFIPLDGSATFLVDTNTNTSTSLPGPPAELTQGDVNNAVRYAGGSTHIVGVSPDGKVAGYLPLNGEGGWKLFPGFEKRLPRVDGPGSPTLVGTTGVAVSTGTVSVTSTLGATSTGTNSSRASSSAGFRGGWGAAGWGVVILLAFGGV